MLAVEVPWWLQTASLRSWLCARLMLAWYCNTTEQNVVAGAVMQAIHTVFELKVKEPVIDSLIRFRL